MAKILVTGAAGFIGFHVCSRLLDRGDLVVGIDNLNQYYDVKLKMSRLQLLEGRTGFSFLRMDIADREAIEGLFAEEAFDKVVNLAAQAGVRYSVSNPHSYIDGNMVGFLNILEGCRHHRIKHLVFASSSSVYGANTQMPFSVRHNVDHPVSLYAATKKANELMAHSYAALYDIPVTGLRYFTVYGPWGRPDMAPFLFARAILEGKPIDVYNHGQMKRDFTYIDDIAEGTIRVLDAPAQKDPQWDSQNPDPSSSFAPYRIYNIGNNQPVELGRFIELLELNLGKKVIRNNLPLQPGDVPVTFADIQKLQQDIGYRPVTSIEEGIRKFVEWYKGFYC